jgi:hypothetical protein
MRPALPRGVAVSVAGVSPELHLADLARAMGTVVSTVALTAGRRTGRGKTAS